jgi:predicted membrane protein
MTITINENILYYWIFSITFETIYCYVNLSISWNQFKKNKKYEIVTDIINQFKQQASFQLIWKIIFNPFSIFVAYIIFCIISPILLPFSLITLFKKMIGYKSPLQKRAEQEKKDMEESESKSKEWMKNEGEVHCVNFIDDIPKDEEIIDQKN